MVKRLHQERRNHERRCGAREQVEAGPQLAGPAFRGIVEVGLVSGDLLHHAVGCGTVSRPRVAGRRMGENPLK